MHTGPVSEGRLEFMLYVLQVFRNESLYLHLMARVDEVSL